MRPHFGWTGPSMPASLRLAEAPRDEMQELRRQIKKRDQRIQSLEGFRDQALQSIVDHRTHANACDERARIAEEKLAAFHASMAKLEAEGWRMIRAGGYGVLVEMSDNR